VVVVKIVSVLNYKGGVGKTTLSACAGQALALTGFRVLAIDNDPQHNLTAMLGAPLQNPSIRDVYHAPSIGIASQLLLKAARKTNVPNLQVVPSSGQVSTRDIKDPMVLQKCFAYSRLERFYDFAIIDNSPGMDLLQEAAIYASNEIFVPTELSQFALDGIVEMQDTLSRRFGEEHGITKIIPNFYRNIKAHDAFALAFRERFPGKITATSIPFDSVFDSLVKEGKILFVHRLSSKAAAFYIKLMHELFDLDEQTTWNLVMSRRKERLGSEAAQRLVKLRQDLKNKAPQSTSKPAGSQKTVQPLQMPPAPADIPCAQESEAAKGPEPLHTPDMPPAPL
jgi:chromosome partitioning protein